MPAEPLSPEDAITLLSNYPWAGRVSATIRALQAQVVDEMRLTTIALKGIETTEAERDRLREALVKLAVLKDGADNGYCKLCGGHRLYHPHGTIGPCENLACLSYEIAAALGQGEVDERLR